MPQHRTAKSRQPFGSRSISKAWEWRDDYHCAPGKPSFAAILQPSAARRSLQGYCHVAYIEVNKPVRSKAEHASIYHGSTYYFVNPDSKKAFDNDPKKYIPAYGG